VLDANKDVISAIPYQLIFATPAFQTILWIK